MNKPLSREYLLKQGHCCNNNCTNCPYKKNNMKDWNEITPLRIILVILGITLLIALLPSCTVYELTPTKTQHNCELMQRGQPNKTITVKPNRGNNRTIIKTNTQRTNTKVIVTPIKNTKVKTNINSTRPNNNTKVKTNRSNTIKVKTNRTNTNRSNKSNNRKPR